MYDKKTPEYELIEHARVMGQILKASKDIYARLSKKNDYRLDEKSRIKYSKNDKYLLTELNIYYFKNLKYILFLFSLELLF